MSQESIYKVIVNHTRELVPSLEEHSFKMSDSLRSLGANSIDRAEIIMMTLETLALKIPLSELAKAENIGELARLIHEKS